MIKLPALHVYQRTANDDGHRRGLVRVVTSHARAACPADAFRPPGYAVRMSDSPLSPQEIRAAAAAHDELGPEYSDAVVASFLERVDEEITARADARLAGMRQPEPPAARDDRRTLLRGVAIGLGVSGLAVFVVGGNADERLHRLLGVLLVLAVICTVGAGWAGRQLRSRWAVGRATAIPGNDRRMI